MRTLEYQFEIEIKKGMKKGIVIVKTERMPYENARDLSDELNVRGIHYKIMEFNLNYNNERRITNKILHGDISG